MSTSSLFLFLYCAVNDRTIKAQGFKPNIVEKQKNKKATKNKFLYKYALRKQCLRHSYLKQVKLKPPLKTYP